MANTSKRTRRQKKEDREQTKQNENKTKNHRKMKGIKTNAKQEKY